MSTAFVTKMMTPRRKRPHPVLQPDGVRDWSTKVQHWNPRRKHHLLVLPVEEERYQASIPLPENHYEPLLENHHEPLLEPLLENHHEPLAEARVLAEVRGRRSQL